MDFRFGMRVSPCWGFRIIKLGVVVAGRVLNMRSAIMFYEGWRLFCGCVGPLCCCSGEIISNSSCTVFW